MTGLIAANHAMDATAGDGGRRAPVLQTEPDEPQVRIDVGTLPTPPPRSILQTWTSLPPIINICCLRRVNAG